MRYLASSILALFTAFAAFSSQAAELPFSKGAFDSAVKAGRPVAVVFHANWCPTCRAQAPVLKQLVEEPKYQALTLFVADFDEETQLKRELHVNKQSTIVVFKNGAEINRSTGETQPDRLEAVLAGAGT
ncbi:MAG TPA: thioredoxin family protein [Steroidobacteraceae bacterium]